MDLTCIKIADPTAPENTGAVHGRGIYLMKALMDDVRFEGGGVVVRMRKSTGKLAATIHTRTRWRRSASEIGIRKRYREHL